MSETKTIALRKDVYNQLANEKIKQIAEKKNAELSFSDVILNILNQLNEVSENV